MDQENWWGKGQFCPADQHSTPRNEKMLKNWEVRRKAQYLCMKFDFVSEGQTDEDDEACGEMGEEGEGASVISVVARGPI